MKSLVALAMLTVMAVSIAEAKPWTDQVDGPCGAKAFITPTVRGNPLNELGPFPLTADRDRDGKCEIRPKFDNSITDFVQRIVVGEPWISHLAGAAFDRSGSQVEFIPMGDFLFDAVGVNVPVHLPDFIADTNGDGVRGSDGDELFVAVDVAQYLSAPPPFAFRTSPFGALFDIVAGVSPELPGYLFSTAAIPFDASSGFGLPAADALTGVVEIIGEHELAAIPEPYTFGICAAGLLALLMRRVLPFSVGSTQHRAANARSQ
jgi:hypothetical protein